MNDQLKIATIRGAGLAFPLACLWYLFSGNLLVFSLILAGGGTGFVIGLILRGRPGKPAAAAARPWRAPGRRWILMEYLAHPNPLVRFGSLMAVGTLLFVLAWSIGYYFLPEGALRGAADAHMARSQLTAPSASVFEEWIKILKANLAAVLIILLGSLLIRVNGVSFGYLVFFFNVIGYGSFIGTNSFAIPYPERLAPSIQILSRSGPYEMTALALLAAVSYSWSMFQVKRIFFTGPERVETAGRFSWIDAVGVALGLAVLGVSNWVEAAMVVSA